MSQLTKANRKKKRYEQRFKNSWLSESQFKDWLENRDGVPHCKICHCKLSCVKTALRRPHGKQETQRRLKNQATSHCSC